jgi:hypothetical protein
MTGTIKWISSKMWPPECCGCDVADLRMAAFSMGAIKGSPRQEIFWITGGIFQVLTAFNTVQGDPTLRLE